MALAKKGKQMTEKETEKVLSLKREQKSESTVDTSKLEEVSKKLRDHKPSLSIGDITDVEGYGAHTIGFNMQIVAPFSTADDDFERNLSLCENVSVEFLNDVIVPMVSSVSAFIEKHPEYDCFKQEIMSGTKPLMSFAMNDKLQQLAGELIKAL